MATGQINVSVENIFPLIKKFLYSDHEIFLRELISNASDACDKLRFEALHNGALFENDQASMQGPALKDWTLEKILPALRDRTGDVLPLARRALARAVAIAVLSARWPRR